MSGSHVPLPSPTRPSHDRQGHDRPGHDRHPARAADGTALWRATYRISAGDRALAQALAVDIAHEQTVELPAEIVPAAIRARGIVGQVEELRPAGDLAEAFDATIAYRADIAGPELPNLLNVLFGNSSIKRGIRVISLELPAEVTDAFAGPRLGAAGLRALTGIADRPLAMTALKPMGLSAAELARLAGACAEGGIDLIKDDHGLVDQRFAPFAERVARCQEAVAAANARCGGCSLYLPMLAGRFEQLEAQMALARAEGVEGVMAAPLLSGIDVIRALAARHGLFLVAHPSFSGTHFHDPRHGITPAVLLGTLFRLGGADASIFPSFGGRFAFTEGECRALAEALRAPLGAIRPALPVPAGGMTLARIGAMVATYGRDCVLLIGGALLQHDPDPRVGAAAFRAAIERAAPRPLAEASA